MTAGAQDDPGARRLAQQLDDLARTVGRLEVPAEQRARLLELAAMTTVHSAALELLTREQAARILAAAANGRTPPRR